MECPSCGAEVPPDADFCMQCGAARPELPAPPTRAKPPEAQPPPPPSKGSAWKWVAVGCIVVLAIVLVLAGLTGLWLLGSLFQSQELPITLPGPPFAEPTSTPHPTPTWLPAPPTPTSPPAPPPADPTPVPVPTFRPAIVMPYCSALDQSPVYVRENQSVTLYWGWLATTEEYVQDFLDTATIEVLLDGEEVRPETQSDIAYDFLDEGYVVSWSADVGTLTPGTHRLEYHLSWSRQISDGWSTYGPGGEYEEEREYCEIIVE